MTPEIGFPSLRGERDSHKTKATRRSNPDSEGNENKGGEKTLKQKPSAFSKTNLLFTIPWFIYLGGALFLGIGIFVFAFDIGAIWIGPVSSLMILTGSQSFGEVSLTLAHTLFVTQVFLLPLWLVFWGVLYFIFPRRWVKIVIVITILEDLLIFMAGISLKSTWGISWQLVIAPTLLLVLMILHLIRTRKKPTSDLAGER